MISALTNSLRLMRAGYVFAREGVFRELDPALLPVPARLGLRVARLIERPGKAGETGRLAAALTQLGPTYVKLGQFLATRPDVVGLAIARELESLQDRMPPFPHAEAVAIVEKAFGQPIDQTYVTFGPSVAAASIAQVHRAEIRNADGTRPVAVKVLRPGIERRFAIDQDAFAFAARHAEDVSAEARRLRLVETVATLRRSISLEMDLRLEAAALSEMAENTKDDPDFRVPAIDWDRTTKDVLTLEWIDGTHLSNHAALEAKGLDLKDLARVVIQSFLRHALRDGFFHADMHPGNLFVDDAGRLVAVDFGIMGRLGPKERRFLAEILYGFITRNYRRTAEVHFEAGYVPSHHSIEDFAQAIRAIGEPIHNRAADEISMAKLLTLLFEVTEPVRHADAAGIAAAAEDHGGGRRRLAIARSEARHVVDRGAGGARMDRAQSRARRPDRGCRRQSRRTRPFRGSGSGAAVTRRGAGRSNSTPSPATASCWRRKRSPISAAPRRDGAAPPPSRCG